MADARKCCALQVCCPNANDRIAALAGIIKDNAEHEMSQQAADDAAKVVLEEFDLVPLGVGAAIVDNYKDYFAELCP